MGGPDWPPSEEAPVRASLRGEDALIDVPVWTSIASSLTAGGAPVWAPSVTLQNALWEALQEGQGCAGEGSLSVGALGDLQGNASMDSQQSACEDSFGRVCVSGHGLGLESGTSSACEDSPLDSEGESAYLNREHLIETCCLK